MCVQEFPVSWAKASCRAGILCVLVQSYNSLITTVTSRYTWLSEGSVACHHPYMKNPGLFFGRNNGHCGSYRLVISSWGDLQTAGAGGELHSQHRACGTSASLHMVAAEATQDERFLELGLWGCTPNELTQVFLGGCVQRVEIRRFQREMLAAWRNPNPDGIFRMGACGEVTSDTQKHSSLGRWTPWSSVNSYTQACQPDH